MNTKTIIIPVIIGIALVLGIIIYPLGDEPQEIISKPEGNILEIPETSETPETPETPDTTKQQNGVEGIVYFVGKPCPSTMTGPPCDGPYPNYEVIIYEIDGKTVAHRTITDDKGNFEAQLLPGDYIVFGKNPGFNTIEDTPILFTIEPNKRTSIEILINEGIR